MEIRYASSNKDSKNYDTKRLREEYLIENLFIENELELREKLDIDEFGEFLDLLENKLENDKEIKKITDKKTTREYYQGQYVNFTEAGYTLVYLMPETYKKYKGDVETFLNSF